MSALPIDLDRLLWKDGYGSSHSVKSTLSTQDPHELLGGSQASLLGQNSIPLPARPRLRSWGPTRSPGSIFWEAPDGYRQSNSLNRRADAMRFTQINITFEGWTSCRLKVDHRPAR